MGRSGTVMAIVAAATLFSAMVTPVTAGATDSCTDARAGAPLPLDVGPCADVLAQETRWLAAIVAGDVATIEAILSPTYKHVNAKGESIDRAAEIASTEPLPFTMNPSDQRVDIAGDTAVIHGVNTLIEDGAGATGEQKVKAVQLFSDVFVLENGVWLALSAQETTAA